MITNSAPPQLGLNMNTPAAKNGIYAIAHLKNCTEGESKSFQLNVIIHKVSSRTAKNGNEFLSAECGDSTGTVSFNSFDNAPFYKQLKESQPGTIVTINGQTDFFQGKLSPRIFDISFLSEEDIQRDGLRQKLIECSIEDPEFMWTELQGFIQAIAHPRLRATVETAIQEIEPIFKVSPAAITMHHAYRHGLLEHTLHMCKAAKALLPLYSEVEPSLAMSGIILHDIGKTVEYAGELSPYKTRTGLLQGHVVLGYRIVRKAALQNKLESDLLERLEHIILSHQGELEWGAAVMAATPEAVFVSMVDNLDARMGMIHQTLRRSAPNEEFSSYIPGLKSSLLLVKPSNQPDI